MAKRSRSKKTKKRSKKATRKKAKKAVRKKAKKKATRKKATRKKATRKKATRKKATRKKAKKAVRKKAKKKATRKKATRKKAVRKAPKRKVSRKKTTRPLSKSATERHRVYNLTKQVPEEQFFVLANGQPVKHVAELASLLDQIDDHVFHHHVTPDRNDFHNWVKHIFQDIELARKISGVSDKKKLQLVIYRHLAGHD